MRHGLFGPCRGRRAQRRRMKGKRSGDREHAPAVWHSWSMAADSLSRPRQGAFMALLVLGNTHGELTPLERGMHALRSGMAVRAYAAACAEKAGRPVGRTSRWTSRCGPHGHAPNVPLMARPSMLRDWKPAPSGPSSAPAMGRTTTSPSKLAEFLDKARPASVGATMAARSPCHYLRIVARNDKPWDIFRAREICPEEISPSGFSSEPPALPAARLFAPRLPRRAAYRHQCALAGFP